MPMQDNLTTLVCLFHHRNQAEAAMEDLLKAGVPEPSVSLLSGQTHDGGPGDSAALASISMPEKDMKHLQEGLRDGGTIVVVGAIADHVSTVEGIFKNHSAGLIDEADTDDSDEFAAAPLAAGTAIPVVEEELSVGKRTVDNGSIRVYRRIVEIPVEESVNLREEHVVVDRKPVDRAATDADFLQGDRTLELTETAEEAVVGKTARVVEEVRVGKDVSEHVETVQDTVRRTEVDVEEIPASETVRSSY